MEYQKFGQRLKQLRTCRNMTQKQLDELLQFELGTITRYEDMDAEPSLSDLLTIAHYLNVTAGYLLGEIDFIYYPFPLAICDNYIEILQILDILPRDDVAEVLRYTKYRLKLFHEEHKICYSAVNGKG